MHEQEELAAWQKLRMYAGEIDTHADRLKEAKRRCEDFLPLSKDAYDALDMERVEHIDWMLYRFSKMQDTMAKKFFPLGLTVLENDATYLNMPIIDILNRMEKIGLLPDVKAWRALRGVRNMIAHDYEMVPEKAVDTINRIYASTEALLTVWRHMRDYCAQRGLL